jgi:hypothetical protein
VRYRSASELQVAIGVSSLDEGASLFSAAQGLVSANRRAGQDDMAAAVQPCSSAGVEPGGSRYHLAGTANPAGLDDHSARGVDGAIQQADAADEARLEASGSTMVGQNIMDGGKVVHASQLIRSVRQTTEDGRRRDEHDQQIRADGTNG